jgi:thimet oligopeptidase
MGFDLPKEEQAKLKENLKKISELSTRFQKNINDYQDSIIVTREELDGLPEHYIHHLRQDESGNYLVTLEYPDLHPFMENAKNAEKRRELSLKYLRKGGPENISLAQELLRLRHENALLLRRSSTPWIFVTQKNCRGCSKALIQCSTPQRFRAYRIQSNFPSKRPNKT